MKFKRVLIGTGIFTTVLLAGYFLFRNTLLHWAFGKMQTRAQQDYSVKLSAADIRFSELDKVQLHHLVVQPEDADTLLQVKEMEYNLSLMDLLTFKIGFDEIRVRGAKATIYNQPERNNFHFHAKAKAPVKKNQTVSSNLNFHKQAKALRTQFFRALHTAFYLDSIQVNYTDSTNTENIFLPRVEYNRENFSALLINQKADDSIVMAGKVLKKNEAYQLSIQQSNRKAYLPFLNREHSLQCRFQSVSATVTLNDTREELQINTDCEAKEFKLNHWRIANEDVVFPQTQFKGVWKIRDDAVELDSTSSFTIRQIPVRLFARYAVVPDTTFAFNIQMPETVSDSFFNALPKGMFNTLKGISCTGTLAYQLQFFINTAQPDSLVFLSSLTRKNFRVNHYGVETYGRINAPFVYDAYDKDRLMRQIAIGEENPSFTPLMRISPYLVKSVLQSEDPSFMQHRGFLPEAFRESVIKNYKERRFARGGSTISMQLVKNVFLSRDKTISRKAEEALIVYLIENLGLVSKDRMLEIYLNVIEWGPNVYGIGEASRFYFNKRPAELNLQESIFLASIIPAPKYFKYRFDKEGNLRPSIEGYFRILTNRMAGKGWLTTADTTGLKAEVKLKGMARLLVVPVESIHPAK